MARHHSQVQLSPLQELYLGSCSYYGNIQYNPVNGDGERKEMCLLFWNMTPLHNRKWGKFALNFFFQLKKKLKARLINKMISHYVSLLPCEPLYCWTDPTPVPFSDSPVPSGSWLHLRTSQWAAEEAPQCPVLIEPRSTKTHTDSLGVKLNWEWKVDFLPCCCVWFHFA